MQDIQTPEDIDLLVREFYKKATIDPLIGYFFTVVVQLDFEEHIPKIASFWENILLGTGSYRGNPMVKHIQLNRLSIIEEKHFNRWLSLWGQTVQENFSGPLASEAISRARSIAGLMLLKIRQAQ